MTAFDRLGVAVDEVMTDESEFAGDLAGAWLGARSGGRSRELASAVLRLLASAVRADCAGAPWLRLNSFIADAQRRKQRGQGAPYERRA